MQLNWKGDILQRALMADKPLQLQQGLWGVTEGFKLELGTDFHFFKRQPDLQMEEWTGKGRDSRPVNKWQVFQKCLLTG